MGVTYFQVIVDSLNVRSLALATATKICTYNKGYSFRGCDTDGSLSTGLIGSAEMNKDIFASSFTVNPAKAYVWVKIPKSFPPPATNGYTYACYQEKDLTTGVVTSYMTGSWSEGEPETVVNPYEAAGTIGIYDSESQGSQSDYANSTASEEGLIKASKGYTPAASTLVEFKNSWDTETSGTEFFNVRSVLGVFGLPYQFLPIADPRLTNAEDQEYQDINKGEAYGDTLGIGAKFAEQIIANMPILFMSPGKPNFMGKYGEDDKKTVLDQIMQAAGSLASALKIDDLVGKNGRYYTFEYTPDEYYKYVNPMCRIASAYMNVAHYYLDGIQLQSVNWKDYTTSKLSGILNNVEGAQDYLAIPFYIESETQIQDSFGNSTSDSTLASGVNSISDMARELQFLLGYAGSATDIDFLINDPDIASNSENLSNSIDKLLGSGNNFLGNLKNHLVSVATGGKMIFPKIWSGSDFARSYDITIKLRSPDMDNLSLYFNIVAPTLHLVGFVAPHMLTDDPNSYGNPFIVRAIYKGFFNVDMGIITGMSITKGDTGAFNANGVPSTVDISFTITDLYEVMSITKTDATDWKFDTLNNTALMDYIANFCGINMYKPEVGRTISMWFVNNFSNRARDYVAINLWGNMKSSIANAITGIFRS